MKTFIRTLPHLLIILILFIHYDVVKSELYTALVEMEELLDTEAVLISNLDKYIEIQQNKLDFLKK